MIATWGLYYKHGPLICYNMTEERAKHFAAEIGGLTAKLVDIREYPPTVCIASLMERTEP